MQEKNDVWKLSQILFVALSLLISGCSIKVTRKIKNSPLNQNNIISGPAQLKLKGVEPYQYQAQIQWSSKLEWVSLFVNDEFVVQMNPSSPKEYLLLLDHNEKYNIKILNQDDLQSDFVLVSEWTITTPLDIVLTEYLASSIERGPQTAPLYVVANRVFISNPEAGRGLEGQASAMTHGRDLFIDAQELIAGPHSRIETFPRHQKASRDQPGRSGGQIVIKAKQGRGNLSVHLYGEHGGDGSPGQLYDSRAEPGADGDRGFTIERLLHCHSIYSREPDRFGPPPSECQCSDRDREGHRGKQGQKGAQGRPGSSGRRGGDSGRLILELSQESPDFRYQVDQQAGQAGQPGQGGSPQQGGLGGKTWFAPPLTGFGPPMQYYYCAEKGHPIESPLPPFGPDGPEGEPGLPGPQEVPGRTQPYCVSVGEGFGRCANLGPE